MKPRKFRRRGFTLVEVLLATGLLGIIGLAILAFLSAFARGAAMRTHVSDPALEGALAVARLKALAPQLRCTLESDDERAALWLSDAVPSRTVHLSELGWLRFEKGTGDLFFERIDPVALASDRGLESEFLRTDDFFAVRDHAAHDGILSSQIIAEGLDHVAFGTVAVTRSAPKEHEMTLASPSSTARLRLPPAIQEEPLR